MSNFPKIMYHKDAGEDGVVVESLEHYKTLLKDSLGGGWTDSPVQPSESKDEPKKPQRRGGKAA